MPEVPLTIAVDVGSITPGGSGGVAHVVVGLVNALGQLVDGSERYIVTVRSEEQSEWLRRFTGPNVRLVTRASPTGVAAVFRRTADRAIRAVERRVRGRSWPSLHVPISDGFYETLGCDVVHFPHQSFEVCALPTIYNPHDLQHLHYPQFFDPAEIARRQIVYNAGTKLAHTVAVASQWIKDDIVRQYGVHTDKIQVIPLGAPTVAYPPPSPDDLVRVSTTYELKPPFLVYPAQTWPHKNHLRLLEALAHLRDARGLAITAIFTGSIYRPFWPRIARRVEELRLAGQARFVGFVPDHDLRSVYRLAEFLVMPTLFESDSFPIFEAWLDGLPVTCSGVTALPDQVADAALIFDPKDVVSIADAIERLTVDPDLREDLRQRGHRRLRDFNWEWTAKAYRAVYRRAVGRPLDEQERWLLRWDWMRQPRPYGGGGVRIAPYTV